MKLDQVRLKIKKISNLSTLPEVVHKVAAMTENPDTTMDELAAVISADQVLTARILKMVNSVFYGFPRRVSTIKHALILLGMNVIRSLVFTCSVFGSLGKNEEMAFDKSRFWVHSIGTAQASGILAERLGMDKPEEINIAGLLHDLGKIVMEEHLADEYNLVHRTVEQRNCLIREAEEKTLGFDHTKVAQWLLRAWELPDKLVEPVSCHHDPDQSDQYYTQTSIVHLADIICRAKGVGTGGDSKMPLLDRRAWKSLELTFADLEEIFTEFDHRMSSCMFFSESS